MDNIAKNIIGFLEKEKYPVLVRDEGFGVLSCNDAASEMLRLSRNTEWKCHNIIHNLASPLENCYCGKGTSNIHVTKVFEPWLNESFQHIYIPIHRDGRRIGSFDILDTIDKSLSKGALRRRNAQPLNENQPVVIRYEDQPVLDCDRIEDEALNRISIASLTPKEREVLNYLMNGNSSSEISMAMKVSMNTVNYHMKNIFSKLRVANRTHASALVYKQRLTQSDTLVREMNHRVKNSFAILSSLVNLKMNALNDDKMRDTLKWIDGQIKSFTDFHELLMNTTGGSFIPIKSFFEESINHMEKSYAVSDRNIKMEHKIQDVSLHMDIAIPCVQIINELVTNAIQHAFINMDEGEIFVGFEKTEEGKYTIVVSDNGRGISRLQGAQDKALLGMKLVKLLVSQINGEYSVQSTSGTKHSVVFCHGDMN